MKEVLKLPFSCRGNDGLVSVRYGITEDADHLGFGLLKEWFEPPLAVGYPAVEARVSFGGAGYARYFGWLQMLKTPQSEVPQVDQPPVLVGDSPLMTFGYLPTLFDAPANPEHPVGDWTAEAFLVALPDAVVSKAINPVAGFRWGYRKSANGIEPYQPRALNYAAWEAYIGRLSTCFPEWRFEDWL